MLETKNPIWIAASHLTEEIEGVKKAAESGAGAIILKTINHRQYPPCNRQCNNCERSTGGQRKGRLIFVDKATLYSLSPNGRFCEPLSREEGKSLLMYLKVSYPNITRIANIIGGSPEENVVIAKEMEKVGAQAIELNIKFDIRWYGRGLKPDEIKDYTIEIAKNVKRNVSIPVIAKLTDYLLDETFFKKLSRYCNGITVMNTINKDLPSKFENCISSVIKKRRCAVGGEPLWRYVKKYIPIAKKYFKFVSAAGGIITAKRVKEIMLLGADTVQICSGIEFYGYGFVKDIISTFRNNDQTEISCRN